jgi:hypothetical protein
MSDLAEASAAQIVTTLDERARRISQSYDRCAIEIGNELIQAKLEHPGRFTAWIADSLPFGIDQAERLMAITRCFAGATEETMAALPSPKSALFELTRLPADRLQMAIANGDVHPGITTREARQLVGGEKVDMPPVPPSPVRETRIGADIVAKELMRFPREQLSDDYTVQLRRWLG